jgi:hypothetical protein
MDKTVQRTVLWEFSLNIAPQAVSSRRRTPLRSEKGNSPDRNANENNDNVAIPGGGTVCGNPLKINEHFCKVAALNRKIVMDWKNKLQSEATA